ncbi:vegetative cell wall protein gp1-like [Panicum virgatum]|uniref:Uncharacterized protein n=1 Tax=Panicum virgatum TaxID=38727 RepID=A0A8T0TNF0_PANVG|nr:vegetative cell wall protein gp1-like [Panicum virgatum]KAG2611208.1 hypothetical protein PVAP13_4KG124900 [Panicum virgatum]
MRSYGGGGAFPAARAWIRLGFPRLDTSEQWPPAGTVRRRRLSALSSAALPTSRRRRCPRPPRRVGVLPELDARPFHAEIRAAPLSSPLPPLPPFLLPPASLFVFFFPATHSGGSSTSSGSARVSSAASTTARARASLSPSRERDPWRPPYASSPTSTPPRPRRPAKVQLDLLGLHLRSAAAARFAGSRSGLPLHLLVPAHPVLTLLRHPPPRARSTGASPWPDRTASAAPSPPPWQSRRARRSSPSPPPSSGGLPLNKSDINHSQSGLASRSPWCARRKLQQADLVRW